MLPKRVCQLNLGKIVFFKKKKTVESDQVVFLQASPKAVAGIKNLFPRCHVYPHGNGTYDVVAFKTEK